MATRPERVGVGQSSFSGMQGSTSMKARPTSVHRRAISSNGWPGRPMQEPLCGEAFCCHHTNKPSRCQVPLGHPEFVAAHLARTITEREVLCRKIPSVQDLQRAWLLLLHCAAASHISDQSSPTSVVSRVCHMCRCSTSFRIKLTPSSKPQRSPLCLVGWACAVQWERACALIGPAGQTVFP